MNTLNNHARTWAALQRTRDRWVADHSRIARGGENAVAGFHYQFLIALRDAVGQWFADRAGRGDPQVFAEILSDIVAVAADGPIHVTQVKRTQTGASVRAALDDLWLIHESVRTFEPELAQSMRYHVVSARSAIRDVAAVIDEWSPSTGFASNALQEFKGRLQAEIDADPESELLSLLANQCLADDPLTTVHRWLGRLVHAASVPEGFIAAAKEIWSDLTALSAAVESNRERGAIYVWQQRDTPPQDVLPGSYLTGERPTPRHLRLGFFARRETVLEPLIQRILAWLTPHPASADDSVRLPVFWIGGRSGTGKSVGLLHALAAIREELIGPVLWLGPHLSVLGEAIRWGQTFRRPGEIVVIGLDDPYAPGIQNEAVALWKQAVSELVTLRQGDDPSDLPVLICCGPTEQAERLERELPDDVFLIREDLPLESSGDRSSLREWFRHRTGTEAPHSGDGNVLLVQLFFEWRVGATLPEFANRLRLRIESAERNPEGGLIAQFSRILALNRLYVGYPTKAVDAALTPAQTSVFLRLQRENHLVADPDDERPGLWLAHPHLSNAIYTAWHSASTDEPIRADHLRQGILAAIQYGDSPAQQQSALWAISRGLDGTLGDTNVADRLADIDVGTLLRDIHTRLVSNYGGNLPQTHLPVWIEIRSQRPDLDIHPNPIEEGITALQRANPESGLRLATHKLLRWLPKYPERVRTRIVEATVQLLERTTEWHEWVPIALDALRRCQTPEIATIVARWAEAHSDHFMVPILLMAALRHSPSADVQRVVARLLAKAGEGIVWGDVAVRVIEASGDSVPEEVATWVERHRMTFGACWVLGRLLGLDYGPAVMWATDWARRFHLETAANWVLEPLVASANLPSEVDDWAAAWVLADHPNAGRLIQLLLRHDPERRDLRDFAMDWLTRSHSSDRSWSYAWEGMFEVLPHNDDLISIGKSWLTASLEHPSWLFVWEALHRVIPNDPLLRSLGIRWLATVPPEHKSWAFVWEPLNQVQAGDAEIRAVALQWLESAPPEHGAWGFIWEALDQASPGDPQLRALAIRWLDSAPPEHGAWGLIWETLDQVSAGDAQLRALAIRWLDSAPPEHAAWGFVWGALHKASPGDMQLRALAIRWLESALPEHGSWGYVWEALDEANPGDAQLRSLAIHWLESAPPEHGSWGFVWEALDEVDPGDTELRSLAIRWLDSAPAKHRSWHFIWGALEKVIPNDAQLRSLGLRWLDSAPPEHGAWGFVWGALHKASPGDVQLRALGLRWLDSTPAEHGAWGFVWEALDQATPDDDHLHALAIRWLESVPPEHGSWGFVWEALDEAKPGDTQLRSIAIRWLVSVPPKHRSWHFVWGALEKVTPNDAQLRSLAVRWLETAPAEHGAWGLMWETIVKASPGDDRLRGLARNWLEAAPPAHRAWGFVWQALYRVSPDDPQLRSLAIHWLETAPAEHGSWAFVWEAMDRSTPGDPRLRSLGIDWLEKVELTHRSWQYLWKALDQSTPGDAQLRGLALRWLNLEIKHRSWSFLWSKLWSRHPGDEQLVELGELFLRGTPANHFRRNVVESALRGQPIRDDESDYTATRWIHEWENGGDRSTLVPVGLSWLETSRTDRLWASVFVRLWNGGERAQAMLAMGERWLEEFPDGRRADDVRKILAEMTSESRPSPRDS